MLKRDNFISDQIQQRREWVFLLLSGIFLGSLALLNVLGITRFIDFSSYIGIPPDSPWRFSVAVGVLAYPITFLCTDFISEIYGRKRANRVVWVGLILNVWVLFVLWLGGSLNSPTDLSDSGSLPLNINGNSVEIPHGYIFYEVRKSAFAATFASMISYLVAQFVDVHIFHYLKKLTDGKKLWLRNNGSTLMSQLVDSVCVILITHFYANGLPIHSDVSLWKQLIVFMLSSYLFKFSFALLDTIPFYVGVKWLRRYLHVEDEIA